MSNGRGVQHSCHAWAYVTERDQATNPPVVIINQTMATTFWRDGADPLTDRLVIGRAVGPQFADDAMRQIVGVVADSRDEGLNRNPGPKMFVPQAQVSDAVNRFYVQQAPIVWVVRTRGESDAMMTPIEEHLRRGTGLPLSHVQTMEQVVQRSTSRQRFNMVLMTVFGCAALLLAAIGIYGLMAFAVQQRVQEVGVRMALGATSTQVRNMVVWQGMRVALSGAAIGVAGALALARVLPSFLFGVTAHDPITFVIVPLILSAVAFIGVWLPARRAARVDPMTALRAE